MIWIVIIAVVILVIFILKQYCIKYDTVLAFTGGLGSGKSFLSVEMAIRLLKRNRRRVKWYNFFHKKSPRRMPMLYSSIPVRISKKEWSLELTEGHLLLADKIVERSVVFIDEIGSYASQFEYKNPNIMDNFDEFIRLFRHYTKGGYLVVNDQCSENIVLTVRRRMNTVFNLMHFKKYFGLFYSVKIRNINISEEIKTIEEESAEDGMSVHFGVLPVFSKRYDTYCYSNRYKGVPMIKPRKYSSFKKNTLLKVSKVKWVKKVKEE